MKIKPFYFVLSLVLVGVPFSHSTELQYTDFLSAIKDDGIRNQVKDSAGRNPLVFFSIKSDFVLLTFPKGEDSLYMSNHLGIFQGKLRAKPLLLIQTILEQGLSAIEFDDDELKIQNSVRDGLDATISTPLGHVTLSDPVILFLYEDSKYSERLNRLILSTLEMLFEFSKFDATIYKYLDYSIDDFEVGVETFGEFIEKLKKQRAALQMENQKANEPGQ